MEAINDFNQQHLDKLVEHAITATTYMHYISRMHKELNTIYSNTALGPDESSAADMMKAITHICLLEPPLDFSKILDEKTTIFTDAEDLLANFVSRPMAANSLGTLVSLTFIQKSVRSLCARFLLPAIACESAGRYATLCRPEDNTAIPQKSTMESWTQSAMKSKLAYEAVTVVIDQLIRTCTKSTTS